MVQKCYGNVARIKNKEYNESSKEVFMEPIYVMGIVAVALLLICCAQNWASDWYDRITKNKSKQKKDENDKLMQIIEQQNKLIEELRKDKESK